MAHGVNHAKKIVIGQADELAEKLANGSGADPQTQGKAIGLLVQMIKPMYEADFVTVQTCEETRTVCSQGHTESHQRLMAKIDEVVEKTRQTSNLGGPSPEKSKMSMKLGPLELKGAVVPIFVTLSMLLTPTASVLVVFWGRSHGWW